MVTALVGGVAFLACGDLVIPTNSAITSDDSGSDEAGDLLTDGAVDVRVPPSCDAGTHPVALACTGLYTDWVHLTLAPDVQAYQPGATMWIDGADSSRWVWLPAGSKVDSTDPNDWVFPVGAKFWQEIRLLGKRVETRFLWKMSKAIWFRATYAWSEAETVASELTLGQPNARGLPYEIPPVSSCEKCHNGENDFVLGFEVVGLAMPQSSGLNLQSLKMQGLLSAAPGQVPVVPGDPTTASALAFLHANCGTSCHNRDVSAGAGQTGLFTKLLVDGSGVLPAATQTDTWTTAYKVPSSFTPAGVDAGGFWRLAPGDAAHSTIPWRMARRDGTSQMPPIETHLVDQNDVDLIRNWVAGLPR